MVSVSRHICSLGDIGALRALIIDIAKPFTLMKIKLASDGDAAIDRLLLLAVVQQKNEEERGGNSNVSNFPPLAISCTLKVS